MIISSEETKYTKQIYQIMLNDIERQPLKLKRALSAKDLLCKLGFMQAWLFQGDGNEQRFVEMFKTRVKDIFMQDWHARLETSTRARSSNNSDNKNLQKYCDNTFANFCYQNYLDDINVEKFRTSLSKLRLSSHRLEVEAGRWAKPNKIPYENRKCKICYSLEEFHFVFECVLFVEIRQKYVSKYFFKTS